MSPDRRVPYYKFYMQGWETGEEVANATGSPSTKGKPADEKAPWVGMGANRVERRQWLYYAQGFEDGYKDAKRRR